MNQEEKFLLLKELSARLPYGVFVSNTVGGRNIKGYLCEVNTMYKCALIDTDLVAHNSEDCEFSPVEYVRPYLRPMSSMTENEEQEFRSLLKTNVIYGKYNGFVAKLTVDEINWLHSHHFDYNGLIDMGLAIEVTKENNPYEDN